MKKVTFTFLTMVVCALNTIAQVKNTSYQTRNGEKVLRLEFNLPVDKPRAWKLFTTDEQFMKWAVPLAHIELKTGGYILTNYNKAKSLSDSSSIKLDIINYLENELLTLKVNLNNQFPKKVQDEDKNLQEIIQFFYVSPGKTKVISSMIGWGQGDEWDKTYDFFVKGNDWTYQQLLSGSPDGVKEFIQPLPDFKTSLIHTFILRRIYDKTDRKN